MSSGELRPGTSPETTSWSSCTSSQSRTPRSTGSIRSPDSIFACSIESQQTRTARSRTTLSSSRAFGRFAPTAQTSAPGWSHSPRRTGSSEVVTVTTTSCWAGVAVALAGLGADLLAEREQALLGPAVGDDPLDRRQRLADARDLALRLPAAADHAERARAFAGEVLRRDPARCAGAQLAHPVRLDHRRELGPGQVEEHDDERRARRQGRVRLEAGQSQLLVHRGHDRERALAGASPCARTVPDRTARLPLEARLDRRERVGRREQLLDVRFGQVERQSHEAYCRSFASSRTTILLLSARTTADQGTTSLVRIRAPDSGAPMPESLEHAGASDHEPGDLQRARCALGAEIVDPAQRLTRLGGHLELEEVGESHQDPGIHSTHLRARSSPRPSRSSRAVFRRCTAASILSTSSQARARSRQAR